MDPNNPQNNQGQPANPPIEQTTTTQSPTAITPPLAPAVNQTQQPVAPSQTIAVAVPGRAWYRFWASVIDSIYVGIGVLLIVILLSFFVPSSSLNIISGIVGFLMYFIYMVYFTANRGRTYGKDAYGLKVVRFQTSQNISYGQAVARELVKYGVLLIPVIGTIFYTINGLIIVFSHDKRGIHDKAANTQVVKVGIVWNIKQQLLFILLPLIILVALIILFVFIQTIKLQQHPTNF